MTFWKAVLTSTLLIVAVPGVSHADMKADVEAANAAFAAAFNRGDAAAVAAYYTEDAVLLPPNENIVNGRSNIEAYWKALVDAGLGGFTLTSTDASSQADLGYDVGNFSIDVPGSDGAKTAAKGKYVVIWKNVGGKWLLHRDMWNHNPAK